MSTPDIVERLEILRHEKGYELAEEVADEIRRLREQCETLHGALIRARRSLAIQPHPLTSSSVEEKRAALADIDQALAIARAALLARMEKRK